MYDFKFAVNEEDIEDVILKKTVSIEEMFIPTGYIPLDVNLVVTVIQEGERKTQKFPFYTEADLNELIERVPDEDVLEGGWVRVNEDPYKISMISINRVLGAVFGLPVTDIDEGNFELTELERVFDPTTLREEVNIHVCLHDASDDTNLHMNEVIYNGDVELQTVDSIVFIPMSDVSKVFDALEEATVMTLETIFDNEELH